MTKTRGALSVLFLTFSLQAAPIAGLYNTGVDNAGVQLPGGNGVTELHWFQASLANAFTYKHPSYIPETLTGVGSDQSRWISVAADGLPGSSLSFYRLTLNLTSPTATITGRWAADNCGIASLNFGPPAFSAITDCVDTAAFTSWTPFTITSGFVTGINTLTFRAENRSNVTGLRVEFLSSDDGGGSAVPEPSTYGMLGSALALAGLLQRRRCRA